MNENRFGSPRWLTDALQAHFGPFDIDLAAEPWSAVVPRFITKEMDLLSRTVQCGHAYLNPPYGRGLLEKFIPHARELVVKKFIRELTMLVPHYTAEGWYRHVEKPEGRTEGAHWYYGRIGHERLKEWARLRSSGLVVDLIKVKGRIGHRFPPRYTGARTLSRFSSLVVRFVQPEAA